MEAMRDAGLDDYAGDKERVGVCIGSGIGGLPMIEETQRAYLQGGLRKISPFFVPGHRSSTWSRASCRSITASQGPNLGDRQRVLDGQPQHRRGGAPDRVRRRRRDGRRRRRGDAYRRSASAASARRARCRRATTIRRRRAGRGTRTATASCWARAPASWCSRSTSTRRRAARAIYCELAGYGMSADAHHITAPPEDGDGAARSMLNALRNAALQPTDIDYINAHGTSTPLGDVAEMHRGQARVRRARVQARRVVDQVDDRAPARRGGRHRGGVHRRSRCATRSRRRRPTSSTSIRSAISISCRTSRATMTIRVALSNSFGFGGTNATLAFRALADGAASTPYTRHGADRPEIRRHVGRHRSSASATSRGASRASTATGTSSSSSCRRWPARPTACWRSRGSSRRIPIRASSTSSPRPASR